MTRKMARKAGVARVVELGGDEKSTRVRAQRRGGHCVVEVYDRRRGHRALVAASPTWEHAVRQVRGGFFRVV